MYFSGDSDLMSNCCITRDTQVPRESFLKQSIYFRVLQNSK